MRMIFRRQNHSSTRCPSCGFMNPGLQSDQVQCHRCSLNFRRIEEIQDIRISSDSFSARTDRVKGSPARFPKPRPPKPQSPEDDISRYKQVQLVDVDFKIGLSTVDQLIMKAALKLSSGDLSDTEHLAERLALVYGLSEADSLALSQKIDVQHAHIRFLQRQQLDSNTDSDIVSGVRSKNSLSPSKTAKEIQDELRAKTQGLFRAPQEAAAKAAVASHSGDHGNVYGGANSSDNNGPLELSYEAPFSHKRDYVLPSANVRNEISRKGGWGSQFSPFFGKVTDSPLAGLM
ncbi:hypothetical protein M431DRAFT_173671 [Trichoderma harzianum CBS 226.95]|uniref:Uncharacterized protein n=1 Tax=Trichoderma harzianum CBS 226.95 TaxID=983964 RepID=A0A2T4AT08_TRIHA|nr:hypothetical protein M431DRAFT_173671 [Trichoderma harzianum CBS 226.95]PTB60190.1 hypothetical protein M431DRAFT_173671 [Trichoderma harzianum CBS 226.95]